MITGARAPLVGARISTRRETRRTFGRILVLGGRHVCALGVLVPNVERHVVRLVRVVEACHAARGAGRRRGGSGESAPCETKGLKAAQQRLLAAPAVRPLTEAKEKVGAVGLVRLCHAFQGLERGDGDVLVAKGLGARAEAAGGEQGRRRAVSTGDPGVQHASASPASQPRPRRTSMGESPSGHVRVSLTPPAWLFEQPLLLGGT